MMKFKKTSRIISIIVCVFMLSMLISACGSKKADEQQTATIEKSADNSTDTLSQVTDPFGKYTPALEISTVRPLGVVKFLPGDPDKDSLEKNIWARAYEEQLGIKLSYRWTPPPDQYEAKWNVAIASGDIPDMGPVTQKTLKMLVNGGLAEDLTDIFEKYASPDYKKFNVDDGGLTKQFNTFDGKLMGLPVTGSQPDNTPLLFVRTDWLKKLNLPEPKTMDDVLKISEAFTKNKPDGKSDTYGLSLSKDINQALCNMAGFLNGYHAYYKTWIEDKEGKLAYGSIQPEMKPALQKLQDMYKTGQISKDFAVKEFTKAAEDIASGKVGLSYGIFWGPLFKVLDNMKADPKAEWKVYPILSIDGTPAKAQASAIPADYFFVRKGYEYPEAAVKLANLGIKLLKEETGKYGTVDGYDLFSYAIVRAEPAWKNLDKHVAIVDALKSGDVSKLNVDQKQVFDMVKNGMEGKRDDVGFTMVFGETSSFSVINQYKNNNQVLADKFVTFPTPTMETKSATLDAKIDETILKIIMGAPVDEFDKMVADWKRMGGDDITNEVNQWYQNSKQK